jgi:hypothetical protein
VSDYSDFMKAARDFEERRNMTASATPLANTVKSAKAILANDNHRRVPSYVPPAGARQAVTALYDPADVEDLISIGERDGKLWLKFASVPKTLFVFSNVPADVIRKLRTTIDRDDFFATYINDRPEYPVEIITAAKK